MFETSPLIPSPTQEVIMENICYSIQIITLSKCCHCTVSISTKDDFKNLDKRKTDSLLMSVEYICNACGNVCEVYEKHFDYLPLVQKKNRFMKLLEKIKSFFKIKNDVTSKENHN